MEDNSKDIWEDFLNPDILRTNLKVISLFITAYEMLKESIIDKIKDFYTTGFDESGMIIDKKYDIEVLKLNKSPLFASLQWLKDNDVINDKDIELFNNIKACRNELVHEIVNIISTGIKSNPLPLFSQMIDLIYKIEKWWVLNVEIPTDPDLHDKNLNEKDIMPGKIIIMKMLFDIALGSKEESEYYLKEFIKKGSI